MANSEKRDGGKLAPGGGEARSAVEEHFRGTSPGQVVDAAKRLGAPEEPRPEIVSLDLFRPAAAPTRIPLNAYLACALTGLTHDQRQLVFHLSDAVAGVCAELDIDVYEPRKKTDPVHHPNVSDVEVFRTDRERVLNSDLLIHLAHFPSTGSGQELDFAYTALLPILVIRHEDKRASRMVTGIPSLKVEVAYREPEELRAQLRDALTELRPLLEERKLACKKFRQNIVGARVKELREALRLTRSELAQATGFAEEGITQLEESEDALSNPSLLQLRVLATALRTTAAELVAPDFQQLVVSEIKSWLDGNRAARFTGLSARDRATLIRRLLYRVLDQLDRDV